MSACRSHRGLRAKQAGFTLIELIVVVVILGILAATALPRFANVGTEARIAKMNAAAGALRTGAATFRGQWLVAGSPTVAAVELENTDIPYQTGYPDVGGDGPAANTVTGTTAATTGTPSGIVTAAGGLTDYVVTGTATVLTVAADATHAACAVTYTESVGGAPPAVDTTGITGAAGTTNCR